MDIYIGEGNLAGRGVYANRDFKKGDVVIKYSLKNITDEEFNSLSKEEKQFVHKRNGILYLYSNPERYVNHSDTPNTYQNYGIGADVALRDISKGEMITTDSTKEDF